MAEDGEWRDRYLRLSAEHDDSEKDWNYAETQLIQLITRLCVACKGLDSLLDPHLERLRKAARDGAGPKLQNQAKGFSDALVQAQDDRGSSTLIESLLNQSQIDSKQIKKIKSLWSEVAAAPSRASEKKINQLAQLLFPKAAAGATLDKGTSGGSLFGRIINRGSDISPNQILRDVLQAVSWPEGMKTDIDDFSASLGEQAEQDAWVHVVKQISDLAVQAFDKVHQDAAVAGEFLSQLSERILMIDQHMLGDSDRRKASRASGMVLGKAVKGEMTGLSAQVEEGTDLNVLRGQVSTSLDQIQIHVEKHLKEEVKRSMEAEQQAGLLQKQLQTLEKETFDLRRQVAVSHQKAYTDPLTGIANRRAYDERIEQEIARWNRFQDALALVVWDIDDFKNINDVFGHKAGDKALVLIAKVMHECLRGTDFISRYGGEEFVVLLIGADKDDAEKVAEMMCKAVAGVGMHSHKKPVPITVSGGLTLMQKDDDKFSLFERADKAMYQAKKAGKNRCITV